MNVVQGLAGTMRRRRRWLFVGLVLLLGVLVGTLGEVGMRMRGRLPWRPHVAWDMTVEPGGKIFTRHDTLGFTQVPGESKVTFPDGYAFDVTNLDDGLRSTHPLDTYGDGGKDQIWVFGCSFTYGWGLNDRETFPWRLQERLRAYDVVNFAQCGYGTLQALIQLREAFETRGAPRVAVLTYAHFHDQRNTLLRRWRKGFFYYNTLGPLRQPYARLGRNGDLRIRMSSAEYKGWPLMRHSALVHSLEQKYDLLAERYVIHSDEVSKALIRTFARECEAHDTALVVAAITVGPNTARIRAFCKQEGIPVTDIAVDYSALPEYNLLPHDNHPNAAAHRVYAARIEDYLRNNLGVGGEVIGNSR